MTGPTQLFEKTTKGLSRLYTVIVCITVLAILGAVAWSLHAIKDDKLSLVSNDSIDTTPTIIEHMRSIGQWEFLAINDEELVDTIRTGFFSDDELVRIYYGTLRIGIDLRECSEDWIKQDGDTILVTIPEVKLLDYNFIDEARTKSFFEAGTWSNEDRRQMYERARQMMIRRCLTKENLDIAQANAKEQIARTLQPIAKPKIIKITN